MTTIKKTAKTVNVNPNTSPAPTPAPDPNTALLAYVQQTVAELDSVEVGLGADPPLTPNEKRHAVKLRKGGETIIGQIANLAQQQQLESTALNASTMTTMLGKAEALQPLADRLAAFEKHVEDVIFSSRSTAMVMGQQFYALLQRRARTDTELAASLAPVTAFFAYRHPVAKPKGAPTKAQKRATTKAVKALKKTAPELLASAAPAIAPTGQGAAATPVPAAAPQGGQTAMTPAVTTPAATGSGVGTAATTSAHS